MLTVEKLYVNMADGQTQASWQASGQTLRVHLVNEDLDLTLDLGPDVIRQLRQALSWVGGEQPLLVKAPRF